MDFEVTKKVTAIITQGAKAVFTHMFVKQFAVSSSQDGVHWNMVLQDGKEKVGRGHPTASKHSPWQQTCSQDCLTGSELAKLCLFLLKVFPSGACLG